MELVDFPRQEEGSIPMFEHSGVRTGFAEINGGKLYDEVVGKGPVLVLRTPGLRTEERGMTSSSFP